MQEIMNYLDRKEVIRNRLRETAENFVYIGYQLKMVIRNKEYEQDGYSDIVEFAKSEYGLSKDDTYRFIRINEKFSTNGNSEELDAKYKGIAQSKLSEMLNLPDGDLDLITEKTTREEIRALNRFNKQPIEDQKQEPAAGPLQEIIVEFFRPGEARPGKAMNDMLSQLLAIMSGTLQDPILSQEEQLQECINAKGNSTFRKGKYFLFLYEAKDGMKYKVFGCEENHNVSYLEFGKLAQLIFTIANPVKEGMSEWESYYGPLEKAKEEVEKEALLFRIKEEIPVKGTIVNRTEENQPEKKSYPQKNEEKGVVAPAQKSKEQLGGEEHKKQQENQKEDRKPAAGGAETDKETVVPVKNLERIANQPVAAEYEIAGQMQIDDYPEVLPENYIKCHDGSEIEIIPSEAMTVFEYMKGMEINELAGYLFERLKCNQVSCNKEGIDCCLCWKGWLEEKTEAGENYEAGDI